MGGFDYHYPMKKILACLTLTLLLAACGDATKIIPTTYSNLDGWGNDTHAAAYKVFADSCVANANRSKAYLTKEEGPVGVRQNWERVCGLAEQQPEPSDALARQFFESNFTPYKIETEAKSTGTLTGYYEPIIKGSHVRKAPYLTPVYGVPNDLGSRKPYFSREEIEAGALRGRAPVLLYTDDPVMLFFMQIQGSGKVRLPDGSMVGLQYAAQNGYKFVPIGRIMKEQGYLSDVSMQGIRDWLHAHPHERNAMMNNDPSFVFFKLAPGDQMAKGALGLPLTPLRSVAVDDDRAAYGVPTYIDTTITDAQSGSQTTFQRLFVSQDTGGALHGPARGDLFFGRGAQEEWQAGHQNAQGRVYWLLPVAEGVHLRDGRPLTQEELDQLPPPQQAPAPIEQDSGMMAPAQ